MSAGERLGTPRVHLRVTGSTNDVLRELAIAGAPHGTLVTAGMQRTGRGRHGRRWTAPAGRALLMSLLLRPAPRLLPLSAALAVCDVAGGDALIKWPNDVVVPAAASPPPAPLAKLAGILVESRPQERWAVLGIGLNVAIELDELPPELRPGPAATGLPAATMGLSPAAVEPTLALLLAALARRLAEPAEATLAGWGRRDALAGREVLWSGGGGTAAGIDGEGRLVVELAGGGRTAVGAGEIHLRSA